MILSVVCHHPTNWGIEYIHVQTRSLLYISTLFCSQKLNWNRCLKSNGCTDQYFTDSYRVDFNQICSSLILKRREQKPIEKKKIIPSSTITIVIKLDNN